MGLRFRRSVRLFPGVRLNFSRSGISTTVGARGASMTFGSHGTYANVGLPGTGLSYRTKISPAPARQPGPAAEPSFHPAPSAGAYPIVVPPDGHAIQSNAISEQTSPGLSELKRLINEASIRRAGLIREVAETEHNLHKRERELALAKLFVIRLFTQKRIPILRDRVADAQQKSWETAAQLQGCYVDIDFGLDDKSADAFAALTRAFDALSTCQRIWDITGAARTDQLRERTIATQTITRIPVSLAFTEPEIIHSKYKAMRFGSATGVDINLYPGFVMTRDRGADFALVEWRELSLEYPMTRFIEAETVPSDSQIIGQTWAKSNKDGSRDRRFNNNWQIPVVRYGELWFRSPTGLFEAYITSDSAKAETFATATESFKAALFAMAGQKETVPQTGVDSDAEREPEFDPDPTADQDQAYRPYLLPDWIALTIIILVLTAGAFWGVTHRTQIASQLANLEKCFVLPSRQS